MDACSTLVFLLIIDSKACLDEHVETIYLGSGIQEGHVEEVTVKGGHDGRLHFLYMREPAFYCCGLKGIA